MRINHIRPTGPSRVGDGGYATFVASADPAAVTEPPACDSCGGDVARHEDVCPVGQGITSTLETDLDPDAAGWALASAIVDFELTENAHYWAARRTARA